MKGGNINYKEQRGDWPALGCAHGNRGENLRGALEKEPALPIGEKAADPRDDVSVGAFRPY